MSNSIDKINIEVNNSISDLTFFWNAFFKSGDSISQFENNIERSFKEVKERFDELRYFCLYNKNNSKNVFIIDLENGFIFKDGIDFFPEITEKRKNIRLIYFRRRRKEISVSNLKEISQKIWYFLGFQYLDKNENNRKIVIQIDENGNWAINE